MSEKTTGCCDGECEYFINSIQHFSVGDGPGIRTTVFFHGCNLHCPWCHNPETLSSSCGVEKLKAYRISCDSLFKILCEDKDFYRRSGGGVTLSGGEVMLQGERLVPLLEKLKREEIAVYIDTAGDVPTENFKAILPYVSGFLFDIKSGDGERLKKTVGADLSNVVSNLKMLLESDKLVRVRIPLIPGFNADDEQTEKIISLLKPLQPKYVDLLPFHRMGEGKYRQLGLEYRYLSTPGMTKGTAKEIAEKFQQYFNLNIE